MPEWPIRAHPRDRAGTGLDAPAHPENRSPQNAREIMPAVRPERQRVCPDHGIERQSGIKMWKKHAAARWLEAQAVAETFCVDRDKQQIVLAAEIFRGGGFGLLRGR